MLLGPVHSCPCAAQHTLPQYKPHNTLYRPIQLQVAIDFYISIQKNPEFSAL